MSATPYKPVTWGDEPIFTDKLLQMTNNDQWLFENSAKMFYNGYGIKKTSGVKMMAAILILPASKTLRSSSTFNFGSFFTPGCRPLIVTGTNPIGASLPPGITFSFRGIGEPMPDYRGFTGYCVWDKPSGGTSPMYIHFLAIGW
jgi:hypothetical protein